MTNVDGLICWRVFLMIIMLTLIIVDLWADDWDFDFRVMYFSNWGVYLTFVVTVLNLCATFKYKKSLGAF